VLLTYFFCRFPSKEDQFFYSVYFLLRGNLRLILDWSKCSVLIIFQNLASRKIYWSLYKWANRLFFFLNGKIALFGSFYMGKMNLRRKNKPFVLIFCFSSKKKEKKFKFLGRFLWCPLGLCFWFIICLIWGNAWCLAEFTTIHKFIKEGGRMTIFFILWLIQCF